MAPQGVIPSPDSWRKITEVVRDVGRNRATRKARRMPRRRQLGRGNGGTDNDGFPPGTGGCDCGHCFAGVTIPDSLGPGKCCTSHLRWSLVNPWLACADTDLTLEYASDADGWLSEAFEGPECTEGGTFNEYRWQLTIDVTGRSYLTLLLETDNGCDPVCIVYGRDSFGCQCDNTFELRKPYGQHIGVERNDLSCRACIKPDLTLSDLPDPPALPQSWCGIELSDIPFFVSVSLSGSTFGVCGVCEWDGSVLNDTSVSCIITTISLDDDGNLLSLEYRGRVPLADSSVCGAGTPDPSEHLEVSVQYGYGGCGSLVKIWTAYQFSGVGAISDSYVYHESSGSADPWTEYSEDATGEECTSDTFTLTWGVIGGTPSYGDTGRGQTPTSDGVCDETCGEPITPEDTDPGACCLDSVCYDYWDEALCNDFGGTWDASGCSGCEDVGPCCIGGICVDATASQCDALGGSGAGAGSCSDTPGPCDEGACCDAATGDCSQQLEADCQSPNYFWGAGTDCTDGPCDELGACCHNNAAATNCGVTPCECWLLTADECADMENVIVSTYGGNGTFCGSPGLGADCDCRGSDCDFGV